MLEENLITLSSIECLENDVFCFTDKNSEQFFCTLTQYQIEALQRLSSYRRLFYRAIHRTPDDIPYMFSMSSFEFIDML